MRIAVFQGPEEAGAPARNLERLEQAARRAAASGSRLLIAPEMFLTGYDIGPAVVARLAEPVDGPSATAAAEIARRAGVALLYGYPERGADGRVYNSALLLDRAGGRLARPPSSRAAARARARRPTRRPSPRSWRRAGPPPSPPGGGGGAPPVAELD